MKIRTKTGLRGEMEGTVFSGSPMRTTLFNTMRTILYNRFLLHHAGSTDHLVYAAGDDVLCWTRGISKDSESFQRAAVALLGNEHGIGGLGQVAKDFTVGRIQRHSFLSKRFHTSLSLSAVFRLNSRAYKAGSCMPHKVALPLEEYRAAQRLCAADLPSQQEVFRDRWGPLTAVSAEAFKLLESDYGTRLRLRNDPADEDLSPQINFFDDPSWLMKALRVGRAGGKPSLTHRPQKMFSRSVRDLALRVQKETARLQESLSAFNYSIIPQSFRVITRVQMCEEPPVSDVYSAVLSSRATKPRFSVAPTGSAALNLRRLNSEENSRDFYEAPLWAVCPVVLSSPSREGLQSLIDQAVEIDEVPTSDEEDLDG